MKPLCPRGAIAAALLCLLAACASFPKNAKLTKVDPKAGYRFNALPAEGNSESLFVVLTFSGGGTRAGALAYGVMEQLRNTKIRWQGREKSLLSEVDVISSVSGGSFTAAYYGLFRDRLFAPREDPKGFKDRFLFRDLQAELIGMLFNPVNWFKLASPTFGRIDLAAEIYNRTIFEQATFARLQKQGRPFVMLNATDMSKGTYFAFGQERFDYLCSDLQSFKVGRAVAASSDFPVAFTPLTLVNYRNACGMKPPPWVRQAAKDGAFWVNPRRFNRARVTLEYLDKKEHPYVHLLDGGIADNIGLRGPLVALESNDLPWSIPNKINNGVIEKLVVIVVDAKTRPRTKFDRKASPPGTVTVLETASTVPMENYSFDTVERLRNLFQEWRGQRRNLWKSRRQVFKFCPPPPDNPNRRPDDFKPLDLYEIYVGFDQIKEPARREKFLNMATSFYLPEKQVKALIEIGPELMEQTPAFTALKACLK